MSQSQLTCARCHANIPTTIILSTPTQVHYLLALCKVNGEVGSDGKIYNDYLESHDHVLCPTCKAAAQQLITSFIQGG
jgi:hypothetical protein